MKSKITILTFVGLLAGSLAVSAQTDSPAANAATDAGVASSDNAVQPVVAAADTDAAMADSAAQPPAADDAATAATDVANDVATTMTDSNSVAQPADAATSVALTDNTATSVAPMDDAATEAPAADTNSTAAADNDEASATAAASADATETNAAAPAIIPLVVMDDVPLTDAIKNLARQANLNYMLDPKLNFGQPGPDGKPVPQPTVSIRWENITAEQALNALLDNYSLQLVQDNKTHIARVTTKDPAAPPPLVNKVIQLKYASPSNMVVAVQALLTDKRSRVLGDNRTSQLIVLATDKELESIDQLIVRVDTPTKQVLIEAKLLETSKNPSTVKGIDWSSTLSAQHVAVGNNVLLKDTPENATPGIGSLTSSTSNGISQIFSGVLTSPGAVATTAGGFGSMGFLNADGVNAVISFLNADTDTKVLSTPRAVTLDNETATLSVTRAYPIFSTTAGTQGSPGGSQVVYTNLGTILNVTPHISANDDIQLRIQPEVSSLAGTTTKTVAGVINQADIFDFRRIDTQVLIPSGNTLVMGGLLQNDVTKGTTKVPLLGDIPVLGYAFRSKSDELTRKNLLIFITPTIVQDNDFTPTKTDFLKNKYTETPDQKLSWWDSAKPALDWSKTSDNEQF